MTEFIYWKGPGYYASKFEGDNIRTVRIALPEDDKLTIDNAVKIRELGTPSLMLKRPVESAGVVVRDNTPRE